MQENYQKFLATEEKWLENQLKDRHGKAAVLPVGKKDRHFFAFRNGMYNAALADRFFRIDSPEYRALPRELIAANYFPDIDFPYDEFKRLQEDEEKKKGNPLWFLKIPTPKCDVIIKAQNWPAEAVLLFWVMAGRTLRNVGEEDQVRASP